MSLFEKVGKFEALVKKLPRVKALPASVQRTQRVAARFEEKLSKLGQAPSPVDAVLDNVINQLKQTFQTAQMKDPVRAKMTQLFDVLNTLKGKGDAASLRQMRAVVKSLGPLVSAAGATNVLAVLSQLDSVAQKQEQALGQVPAPGEQAPASSQAPGGKQFPAIPVNVQNALSSLMTNLAIGIPLTKSDGKLGPETEQAINNYKKHVPSAAALSGKQLFDKIMQDFKYVHDQQTQGVKKEQILADLKSGTKGKSSDQAYEENLGRQNIRPFPTQ